MSDWKVSRDELLRLLGAPRPSQEPRSPVGKGEEPSAPHEALDATVAPESSVETAEPVALPSMPPAAERPTARPALYTSAHFMLSRALPRLWHYAQQQPEASTPRALHRKLRELVSWVVAKNGYAAHTNVPTEYRQGGETIQGRLELLVKSKNGGAPLLAIESTWTMDDASLLKLEVWHRAGTPVLWITGVPCPADALGRLRARANRILRQPTGLWLAVYHLEHGWVPTRSMPR